MPISIDRFVDERADRWQRLSTLVRRGRQGDGSLTPEEVLELGRVYRIAASDLAVAQRDYAHDRATLALNAVVAEAHALVYSERQVPLAVIRSFFRRDLPRVVRANLAYVGAAFALFALPAAAGYLLGLAYPDLLQTLLPQSLRQTLERHELWTNIDEQLRPFAASLIMTNNILVSFFAFAGGATAGLFTAFVLVTNGLQLGAIFAATQAAGLGADLLTFIAGHGFVELSVIFLAGGAGLRLASAFVAPGELSRGDALRIRGAQALRIVLFCIPCLVVAGLIEGFISPSTVPWSAKLGVGLISGGALWGYLLLVGRG
jgi:uncharacterized membrane protein SpoIIM required for sporulation